MRTFLIVINCLVPLLVGCASGSRNPTPPVAETLESGRWRAKALVKDKDQNRSYLVNLDFNSVRSERARLDVTTTLGTGLASIVLLDRDAKIALITQKRFFEGPAKPEAMKPILAMPFDPRWIRNVFVGDSIVGPGWACADNATGHSCRDAGSLTEVTWTKQGGDRPIVIIDHPKATIQINVQSFSPSVDPRPNLFTLEAPESYQKFRLK